MSLIKYIFRRVLIIIPELFGALTLTFILSRLMPGNPAVALLVSRGIPKPNPNIIAQMEHELGLDLPIIIQYFRYLGELFTGQWGESVVIVRQMPVWNLILQFLPFTADLAIFSIIIASYIGIKIGVISATHRNKARDTIFRFFALVGVSVPIFFMGMLLQYLLGYVIPIFPTASYKSIEYKSPPRVTGFYLIDSLISGKLYLVADYLVHLALPIFCLAFVTLAGIVRQTRSSMLEILEQDYIRTARAKGCKEKDVIHSHALKNALIPTVTIIGLNVAGLLTGAVLTETTFGIYGLGRLLVDSINLTDYWVLNGVVFLMTLIYLCANLFTDVIYAILDPRIRY
jgi:peptide/nickel transport system permease protein